MHGTAHSPVIDIPTIKGRDDCEPISIPIRLLETMWEWDERDDKRSRKVLREILKETRYEFETYRPHNPSLPAAEIVRNVLPDAVRWGKQTIETQERIEREAAQEKARREALTATERAAEDAERERLADELWSQVHWFDDTEETAANLPARKVTFVGFRDDAEFDIPAQDREFDRDWFGERHGHLFRVCTAFEREVGAAEIVPRSGHTVLRIARWKAGGVTTRIIEIACKDVDAINAADNQQLEDLFTCTPEAKLFVKVGRCSEQHNTVSEPKVREPITADQYEFRCFADVERRPISWLWPDRIALGKISIIAGAPKKGKSQVTCAIAGAVTTGGIFPGGAPAPLGSVIFITCEDDVADTIGPRLDAVGADSRKVYSFEWTVSRDGGGIKRLHFDIGNHVNALEAMVRRIGDVKAIFIDPISAYLGKADSHKVADVRGALVPIQALAAKYGIAVILVSHLNKSTSGQGAMERVAGSGAFVAVARSGWLVVSDPDDDTGRRRLMCPLGTNIADDTTGFAFTIRSVDLGDGIKTSKVVFEDEAIPLDADSVLGARQEKVGALADAIEVLRSELSEGPAPQKRIEAAARSADVSGATLRRAKKQLKIVSAKRGSKEWWWSLPDAAGAGFSAAFNPVRPGGEGKTL